MKRIVLLAIFISLGIWACTDTENGGSDTSFDRGAMLRNYADNLILPAYEDARNATQMLNVSLQVFAADQSLQNLKQAQNAWTQAYGTWMYANAYNFGPAGEQGFNKSLNEEIATFPVSTIKVENALISGQFDMNDFNRDARGFLTLEYLLFAGIEYSDAEVLQLFVNQPNRKALLTACGENIESRINGVLQAWQTGYKEIFTSRQGSDVGSSTSQLYNEFVKSFETNKNIKVELPLGRRPGQTQVAPQLVEAYYSGKSLEFLKMHLRAIEDIYHGRSKSGADGIGFREHLDAVVGGPELVASTLAQWASVIEALQGVPTSPALSTQIIENPSALESLREELQRHTRFFKSDMSSVLGIAITFSSGDGD
jgi:uncharacterized protein